jgi:hypothetical protein
MAISHNFDDYLLHPNLKFDDYTSSKIEIWWLYTSSKIVGTQVSY